MLEALMAHDHTPASVTIEELFSDSSSEESDEEWDNISAKHHTTAAGGFEAQVTQYTILAFSTNDIYLAGGAIDGSIIAWELGTGARVIKCVPMGNGTIFTKWRSRSRKSSAAGPPALGAVNSIEFSPISDAHVFVYGTESGMAVWWDIPTKSWRIIGKNVHTSAVKTVKWSPSGKLIATMCMDSKIHLWNPKLELVRTIEGGNNRSSHPLAFSPDDSRLVTADSYFHVHIWNVQNGEEAGCLKYHDGVVWALAFAPDKRRLITGSEDGTALILEANAPYNKLIALDSMEGPVRYTTFSSDGKRVLVECTDGTATLFEVYLGSKIFTVGKNRPASEDYTSCDPSAVLSPDGNSIILAHGPRVILYNGTTGNESAHIEHMNNICGMQLSHGGHRVASAAEGGDVKIGEGCVCCPMLSWLSLISYIYTYDTCLSSLFVILVFSSRRTMYKLSTLSANVELYLECVPHMIGALLRTTDVVLRMNKWS